MLLRKDDNMEILNQISEQLQKGKAKEVVTLVQQAIDEKVPVDLILNEGLIGGMDVISEKFKNHEIFIPEVLIAARAMSKGSELLKPLLKDDSSVNTGTVCIGTIKGDLHDIGKNLCVMMMEGKGLNVINLGSDVDPQVFVDTAVKENCDVIACSALLTTTMKQMAQIVEKCKEAGIRDKVKIMIGGAPVSQAFCDSIGADCYTPDATAAAEKAVAFCKK